jgi:hypothetical protein
MVHRAKAPLRVSFAGASVTEFEFAGEGLTTWSIDD